MNVVGGGDMLLSLSSHIFEDVIHSDGLLQIECDQICQFCLQAPTFLSKWKIGLT